MIGNVRICLFVVVWMALVMAVPTVLIVGFLVF